MKAFVISMVALFSIVAIARGQSTKNPHGDLAWECFDCHNTVSWNVIKPPIAFKHEKTGFSLIGAHASVACLSCHKSLAFSHTGTACADCHTDIHRGQFGIECQNCHAPQSWQNRRDVFELHSSKGFPLVGVHSIADCNACHVNQQQNEFAGTPVECRACHESNFAAATNPNHSLAGFNTECQSCHQPVAANWHNSNYQHPNAFALHGAHARTDCASCHVTQFAGLSNFCMDCHESAFNATTNPAHATFGFPTNCESCHDDVSWNRAQFDHLQASNFELRGAHAAIQCVACHVNNQIQDLPQDCYGCHQNDYTTTTNPSHIQGNFPQECLQCHTENAWQPATFNHANTQFPLTGAHTAVQCIACHSAGYQNTPVECYACHQSDYNNVTDPNHVTNNFDHLCTQCHTTAAWSPSSFNHTNTQFPLTGAHVSVTCISCHASGYQNTPTDCYACHQSDYNNVTDPNHVTNNFDHLCTQCHSTTAWSPASFDHANTQFPLTEAHTSLQCIACHADGYQNTPIDCYSCHQSDYQNVPDPNHVTNNFSHICTDCHNTSSWPQVTFDHSNTQFPLTGAHTSLQCIACHADGYQNTPIECYACHQNDYQNVSDPNHVQNNFDHLCTQCHTTTAWSPATFDHNQTQFPLTGAHVSLQCLACHASGYDNTPTECFACHAADYNNANDPDHNVMGFPTACQDCHATTGWTPTTWNHDTQYFPIFSGRHQQAWNTCADCHNIPNDFNAFECINCHEHNRQDTDDRHTEVPDYQYNSNACYSCHPQGNR